MPKDKAGNELTWKQYGSRWKEGVMAITPYQQAKMIYKNTYVMLFGILAGFIFSILALRDLWWLSIILLAAFVNTIIVQLGNYQKYQVLRRLEDE